ncbi:MAG: zinc metalloprotease HtpX [Cyanobacteriota bacterium]|nr:zinc metalloprotease HtpX [Cyanobacteriota bacterium]
MASVSPSSTSDFSKVNPPSLRAGLAALKQGRAKIAIAHLEGIVGKSSNPAKVLQAQMGLAIAYDKVGDRDRAIATCEALKTSKNKKVSQWAAQTLTSWAKRAKKSTPPPSAKPTGFIPLDEEPASEPPQKSSGFVPLDENATPSNKPTGFVPLDEEPISEPPQKPSGFVPLDENVTPSTPSTGYESLDEEPLDELEERQFDRPQTGDLFATSTPTATPDPIEAQPISQQNPTPTSLPNSSDSDVSDSGSSHQWRNRGRAKNWQRLKPPPISRLYAMEVIGAIALTGLGSLLLRGFMYVTNEILVSLPFTRPIQAFYYDRTAMLVAVLVVVAIASPWLLDSILRLGFGLKPLATSKLNRYSPEAYQTLGRVCRQKNLPFPTLGILPESAPAIFTYGNWPKTARIVVTQGLLDRLEADEIAALYVAELTRIIQWDFLPMSFGVALTQIFYLLYSQAARAGDWFYAKSREFEKNNSFLSYLCLGATWTFAGWSTIGYGLSRLLRLPWLPLSRMRVSYSDRAAVAISGNPNGLVRALFKVSVGIADTVREQGKTSEFLESFDLLMPVSPTAAIGTGSLYPTLSPEELLAWDLENPDRRWLVFNNSHPTLGERVEWLTGCARFWQLEPELELPQKSRRSRQVFVSGKMLLQGAPFFGMAIGFALGSTLAIIGWLGQSLNSPILAWLFEDRGWITSGLTIAGFSLGTLARINSFFPDMKPYALSVDPNFPAWLSNTTATPVDSKTIRFEGKLLGRPGVGNWLGQDSIVEIDRVLVKLHYCSKFGPVGNLFSSPVRPIDWKGRTVRVTGWLRRGATSWIDVDTLALTQKISTSPSGHPIWSSLLMGLGVLWGAYLLSRGGL